MADARARDAERAAGRVRSPFHGVPVVFKDNIDTTELPPRVARARSKIIAAPRFARRGGMKAGGAVVLARPT